jgi:hypothetical protein
VANASVLCLEHFPFLSFRLSLEILFQTCIAQS